MSLSHIRVELFTAFDTLDVDLSPGVNVLVGANATGKAHLMKIAYTACDITKTRLDFAEKLVRVFLPSGRALGRLVKRQRGELPRHGGDLSGPAQVAGIFHQPHESTGGRDGKGRQALGNKTDRVCIHPGQGDAVQRAGVSIALRATRSPFRGDLRGYPGSRLSTGPARSDGQPAQELLTTIQRTMEGKVVLKEEEFFLRNKQGNLEFSLLAEGMRKLGLLWLLIRNGTLLDGSVLFWDEPETNLNPKQFGALVEILLELHRLGVQIFLATHDYVILKELDLRRRKRDQILFHAL